MKPMRRTGILSAVILATSIVILQVGSATAVDHPYFIGGGGGLTVPSGGDLFELDTKAAIGFHAGGRLSDRWQLELDFSWYTLENDTTVTRTDSILALYNNSPLDFEALRFGLLFHRRLFDPERSLNLTAGLGGGLMAWQGVEPVGDTAYKVLSDREETVDFSANELFLTGSLGIMIQPSPRWSLHLTGRADYMTGAGAELVTKLADGRDKLFLSALARLSFYFGGGAKSWSGGTGSGRAVSVDAGPQLDSDGDGVADRNDVCLNTPVGARVDRSGCPVDSDGDGVFDGLDDCPETPLEARYRVDIHGCAVDSDFDGYPDYVDSCATNPVGALVDENGCPLDGDGDGVPDGLDDCPYTLVGVEVDKHGCIELSMLSEPMVLNIDYAPGSFEVDPHNEERLKRLAGLLNFVKDIKLDISGYTDNIGTETANRNLSQKRANRVKGILTSLGVEADRIKVFGRGETNFVASNQTAEGRARNRRIEIVFYR